MVERLENSPTQAYELVHAPRFDIAITTDPLLADRAKKLAQTISDGLKGWEHYKPNDTNGNLRVDSVEQPQFIAKIRVLFPSLFNSPLLDNKQHGQRLFSILNEFALAQIVADILKSEAAQALVQEYGFNSINSAPPLVGLISRSRKEKSIIYDFIDGHTVDTQGPRENNLLLSHFPIGTGGDFTRRLEAIFQANAVDPGDLALYQMMAVKNPSGDTDLYLLDIEDYSKIPESELPAMATV